MRIKYHHYVRWISLSSQVTSKYFSLMCRDEQFCLSPAKAVLSLCRGKPRHRGACPVPQRRIHCIPTSQLPSCAPLPTFPGSSSPLPGSGPKASSVISWMGWDQPRLWGDRRWPPHQWVSLLEGRVSRVMAAMQQKR